MTTAPGTRLADSARRLVPLTWPVFVGQLSVIAFGTVDTLLTARYGTVDLAALAVGASAYIITFIGFMGVVMALAPLVGQMQGARQFAQAGRQVHQAVWVALALSVLGSALLLWPGLFMALADVPPEVEARVRGYLAALAAALPAAMLFSVFRAFNNAISRPRAVMAIQLVGLAAKVPLSALLVFGLPALHVPALGVVGCGIATAVVMWLQVVVAARLLVTDSFYAPYRLTGRGLDRPDRAALAAQLRLGIPMGATILIEVSAFALMAIFISRMGTTPVAGHQIAANLVALLFMMPLAIANASTTLVAQRIGAGDPDDAARIGRHGLMLGTALAMAVGGAVFVARGPIVGLYTSDAAVAAAALPLLTWVAVFHTADAVQIIASFLLRAYRVATLPVLIYAGSLWGIGLGGGWMLGFNVGGLGNWLPSGARGYWVASTAGLVVAALGLVALWWRVQRRAAASAA